MGGSQPGLGEHDGQAVWGDDNARAILGAWTAAGRLGGGSGSSSSGCDGGSDAPSSSSAPPPPPPPPGRWDGGLASAILGNFRQHGVDGFRPVSTIIRDIKQKGWKAYYDANYTECCLAITQAAIRAEHGIGASGLSRHTWSRGRGPCTSERTT